MAVRFDRRRGRLHVGYRAEDWSDVWMEPKVPQDQDVDEEGEGEYDFDLFRFSTGDKVRREPMLSEVKWLPHFDPKNCDSSSQAERKKLHRRFLTDAYAYLAAKDVKYVEHLERQWDNPRCARWQSWFDLAKKFKRTRMPELRRPGDDDPDDGDDDDSAYNSGDEMPPPRTPASLKRKVPGNGGRGQGPKKSIFGMGNHRSQSNIDGSPTPHMSGGLGARSTPSRSYSNSIDGDNDNDSVVFDTTEPMELSEAIQANNRSQIGSPVGSRHRGNSRGSFPTFRARGPNARTREESPREEQNSPAATVENRGRVQEINGDLTEDEAFRIARDASMDPGPWRQLHPRSSDEGSS